MRFTHRVPRRLACAATTFAVLGTSATRLVAQNASQDSRPVVAVLDYINASMRTDADYKALSKGIATVLAGRLGETDSIRIVTREKLNEIMSEQNLATSGRVDPGQAVQVGKLLNAHHIIYGTYVVQPNGDTRITASAAADVPNTASVVAATARRCGIPCVNRMIASCLVRSERRA